MPLRISWPACIACELGNNPNLVLGLPTGSTMERVYRHLVRMHQDEKLDLSDAGRKIGAKK